ncbi:MAG: hypothetical protein Q8O48_00755 [Anaerolineales bacterium]|nr:hypothetical protein [Anaerolineales bacterium]
MSTKLVNPKLNPDIIWMMPVFLVVFFIYILCPVTTSTDSRWTFYISMSMLREHNTNLDEYAHLMEDRDFRVVYLDNHIYPYFPLGVPIISVPFVWGMDKVFDLRYSTDFATYLTDHFPDGRLAKIEKIAASFISALAAVLFYLLVSLRLDKWRSLLLTFIFAFSTPMLSTASRALWQHGLSVLCLTTALWMILRGSSNKWWMFFVGALLGFSYIVRPTNSLSLFFLTLYILINHRKDLAFYFTGLLIPITILVIDSLRVYHSILPPYYLPQRLGANLDFFNALLGNLISPNRGLFISTPIFLISMFGIYLVVRDGYMVLKSVEPYLVLILITHWVTISSFDNWYGGWSLGPRLFTDMASYLAYFIIPVLEEKRLWSLQWWKVVLGTALMLSTLVHFRYVSSIYPMMWNGKPVAIVQAPERVWDLSDLQVLRGTCGDKLEGKAPKCWFDPGTMK